MDDLQKHSGDTNNQQSQTNQFMELYETVWQDMYRFALYYLGTREDAEDAVQETAAQAFKGFSSLRDKQKFRPWIFKILSARCKNTIKYLVKQRKQTDLLQEAGISNEDNEKMIRALEIWEAISKMQNEEKLIVILSVLQGFKSAEIAEILSKPEGTIRSKRHRALQKIRIQLGGDYDER